MKIKIPQHISDALTWCEWIFDMKNKRVKWTNLPDGKRVSTVFLGTDHGFGQSQEPILFETMVFPADSYSDLEMDHYCTWDEAVKGHEAMVKKWSK